jgi:flagellar FliL protein
MAEENEQEAEVVVEGQEQPKKGYLKLILIILGIVVLLAAIGIPVGYFAYQSMNKTDQVEMDLKNNEVQMEGYSDEDLLDEDIESFGAFFPLETFVVNLSGNQFLRVEVQLEFFEREVPKRLYSRLVPLRDKMISIFAARTGAELETHQGRQNLRENLLKITNDLLKKKVVKEVYFTEFIVR